MTHSFQNNDVAIVVPAFNEEKTIRKVITSICEYGLVIVVDDGSTDNTLTEVEAEVQRGNTLLVTHSDNKGYDEALNSGLEKASQLNCDAVITYDADGQHSASLLPIYIGELNKGADLVLGRRPKKQRFSEKLFGIYTKRRLGWSDPLCGMKGYRMSLYRDRGWFDSLRSIGTELAFYGLLTGSKHTEISIPISKRVGRPTFSPSLKANFLILRALYRVRKEFSSNRWRPDIG